MLGGPLERSGFPPPSGGFTPSRCGLFLLRRSHLLPSLGQTPWAKVRRLSVSGVSLRDPIGIAVRADGWLIVAQDDGPLVAIVDPEGSLLGAVRQDRLRGAWWDNTNKAYAVTERAVFEPISRASHTFETPSGRPGQQVSLAHLAAGARNIFGSWFLLDTDPERVVMFEPNGTYHSTLMERNERPRDLVADSQGRMFILHEFGAGVTRFNAEGVRGSPRRDRRRLGVSCCGSHRPVGAPICARPAMRKPLTSLRPLASP